MRTHTDEDVEHASHGGGIVEAAAILAGEGVSRTVVDAVAAVPLVNAQPDGAVGATRRGVVFLQALDKKAQVGLHPYRGKEGQLGGLQVAVLDLCRHIVVHGQEVEIAAAALQHRLVPSPRVSHAEQAGLRTGLLDGLGIVMEQGGIFTGRLRLMEAVGQIVLVAQTEVSHAVRLLMAVAAPVGTHRSLRAATDILHPVEGLLLGVVEGVVIAHRDIDVGLCTHLVAPRDKLVGAEGVVFRSAPDEFPLRHAHGTYATCPVVVVDGSAGWPSHHGNVKLFQQLRHSSVFSTSLVNDAAIDHGIVAVFQHLAVDHVGNRRGIPDIGDGDRCLSFRHGLGENGLLRMSHHKRHRWQ